MRYPLRSFFKYLGVFAAVFLMWHPVSAAEILFVQAVKAPLRSAANSSAGVLSELARGATVEVIKKEGLWIQVKAGTPNAQTGWISKLVLSANKPVGAASLVADLDKKSLEMQSRARPSGRAESAATTRNLVADSRARPNQDAFRVNEGAVDYLKSFQVSPQDLDKFQGSAKLSE